MYTVKFVSSSGFDSEIISKHRSENAAIKAALKYVSNNPDKYNQVRVLDPQGDKIKQV